VVYHLHEVSIRPPLLKRLLCAIANLTADRALFVSHFVKDALQLRVPRQEVVYNALPLAFLAEAQQATAAMPAGEAFVVLMACSLKDYKGVPEFFQLARSLPDLQFDLVLNASPAQVQQYRAGYPMPGNLTLLPTTRNMHPLYQRASVVVNLSRPAEWVETFGMTILEAMQYGKPVIVPTVGGVAEVNLVGQTGFAIDGRDLAALQRALCLLKENPRAYSRMARACRERAAEFTPHRFAEQIQHYFQAEFAQSPSSATLQLHQPDKKLVDQAAMRGEAAA
jgi:glycosyltransferase involved in cell wall biosynthesis